MDTSAFRTKTSFQERKNISFGKNWTVALDIGYSAVKGFSPNAVYCFPSYAKRLGRDPSFMGTPSPNQILYRDNDTGIYWMVGESAQEMVNIKDTNETDTELYGRSRYYSPMFNEIARCGIALGMISNSCGNTAGKNIYVQTGLPSKYLSDTEELKEALSGQQNFSVKIGNRPMMDFRIVIPKDHIGVIPQPLGTLMSISKDANGRSVPDARKYFSSNLLILDIGFGTLDTFNIKNGLTEDSETFNDSGMHEVFYRTCKRIWKEYGVSVTPAGLQQFLDAGNIKVAKRTKDGISQTRKPFGEFLEEESRNVCQDMLVKLTNAYDGLFDYDYLIVTGGTGAAWFEQIKEYFKDVDTLTVLAGNQNDTLSPVYANARGYYFYRLGKNGG